MLNRRDKRRYVAIWVGRLYDRKKITEAINERSYELFGHIATEKARIRFVDDNEEGLIKIFSCKLELLSTVLSIVGLMRPPVVLIRISGTLKAMRRELKNGSSNYKQVFL